MKLRSPKIICTTFRCIVFLLVCVVVSTQQADAQQLLWQRVFDTGQSDQGNDVATDSQGNIIVAGTAQLQSIQPPNFNDFLIVKYNPLGDTLWTRRFDADVYDAANGVAIDKADNIIVVGGSYSSTTYAVMKVVKYNAYGSILWTQTFGSAGKFMSATAVAVDTKNNIIVTGVTSDNHGDYITIKYDSSGNLIWMRTYDIGWNDTAQDVAVDDSDNVIVAGYSNDMNWDWFTIKYSPDGDTMWVRRHDVALDDKADGVTCDKDGNVIVVGRLGQSPTKYASIVKYSPTGDTLWTKLFVRSVPLDGLMNFVDVVTDKSRNIYAVGNYVIWDNGSKYWIDYYVVKCTPQGDTLWTTLCDVNLQDEPNAIALDKEGNIIVTGTTSANPNMGEYDLLTVKLHNVTNRVSEENIAPHRFLLYPNYPNPFNPNTTISYQLTASSYVMLKVYDVLGREMETLVNEKKPQGIYHIKWDASRYTSGIYIARLTAGNYVASQKLLLIK